MFQAVRRWWRSGRRKNATRLFLFEFLVVVVGVLTAQGLADWVSERSEARAVRAENARIRYEIGRARQNARVWIAAIKLSRLSCTPSVRARASVLVSASARARSPRCRSSCSETTTAR